MEKGGENWGQEWWDYVWVEESLAMTSEMIFHSGGLVLPHSPSLEIVCLWCGSVWSLLAKDRTEKKKARKSGPRKPENGCINLVGKQHKMINLRQSGSWAAARQKGFGCCFPVKRIFGVLLFRGKGSKVVLGKSFPHTLARFLALLLLGGIGCKPILLWPNRKSGWKNQNQTSFAFKGINEMFDSG